MTRAAFPVITLSTSWPLALMRARSQRNDVSAQIRARLSPLLAAGSATLARREEKRRAEASGDVTFLCAEPPRQTKASEPATVGVRKYAVDSCAVRRSASADTLAAGAAVGRDRRNF